MGSSMGSSMGEKVSAKRIMSCRGCHEGRVKKLSQLFNSSFPLFVSCGEDGKVMEYDMRSPHHCSSSSMVLVDNKRRIEWNTISTHPAYPFAVYLAGSSPSIFHFDLRSFFFLPSLLLSLSLLFIIVRKILLLFSLFKLLLLLLFIIILLNYSNKERDEKIINE